jgi:hypothetical protein
VSYVLDDFGQLVDIFLVSIFTSRVHQRVVGAAFVFFETFIANEFELACFGYG